MIIEIKGKQTKSNFYMFDGGSFQAWNYWDEKDPKKDGKMFINIDGNNIEKIIIVMKE